MNLKPLNQRVIIEQEAEKESQTKSGIFIPANVTKDGRTLNIGKVLTADNSGEPGYRLEKGDTVAYTKDAGMKIEFGGEEHLILERDQVICIIDQQ